MPPSSPVFRYKLILSYDGTNFSGWQKQLDARTVQGDLLTVASRVFAAKDVDIQGCGRTDSGVHALAYAAHLQLPRPISPEEIEEKLNLALPKDMAILAVEAVGPTFHARHHCLARRYVYRIFTRKSAFGKRYGWWIQKQLDVDAMQKAATLLVGQHDFKCFAEKQEMRKSTAVRVYGVDIDEASGLLCIRVTASHFLWHMVRKLVWILVEIGSGQLTGADIVKMLNDPTGSCVQQMAPAAGLFFEKAIYSKKELADAEGEGAEAEELNRLLPGF